MNPPIWFLIDGNNQVHKDFHAAGPDRVAINWRNRLRAIAKHFRPSFIVVAFDCGRSWRYELLPTYKGERQRNEGIAKAIEDAKAVCIEAHVDTIEVDGFEADDLIATFARVGLRRGNRVVISSSDKDLHQLIRAGEVLQMTNCRRQGEHLEPSYMNERDMLISYGIKPCQWIDYRCIVGDKSDNIEGVPGVGAETAKIVLESSGSLAAFYAHPWKVKIGGSAHAKLIAAKPRIPTLRRLLTLRDDVPMPAGWEEFSR